ncbi:antibacterial peptide PMAP-36-like isoform X2 [Ambystoma mexicanum]|uniref:antibacterial peptide PMAP-36-like isoform X2 n=1 Tax=Ambystoma mexicanum TaxID=8296 RepID=UPI0037E9232C
MSLMQSRHTTSKDTPTHPGQLQFTIKETACAKQLDSQHKDKCAFKDLGQVKDCTATIFPEDLADTIVVICDTVEAKAPVRRSRQARQCVREKGRLKCKPPPRPGFASAVARTSKDKIV